MTFFRSKLMEATISSLLLLMALVSSSCSDQPAVDDKNYFAANVLHIRFTDPCSSCHEQTRLGESDGVEHGFGRDCGECHQSSDDPEATRPWEPLSFSHFPPPEECLGCHAGDRPSRDSHPQAGDCTSCHKFPSWNPPSYD